jgi:mannose-6-phosphate isomerase-like protein (cupin superfamily)
VPRPSRRTWDRGGSNAYSSDMHKTETVDYAILLEGARNLVLDDGEVTWQPGDVVIDVAAWHQWSSPVQDGIVLYDMIAAHFVDGLDGLVQGNDPILRADPAQELPDGVKPARRIICLDKEPLKSSLVADGPSPDVRFDPARPGFAWARMWVTDGTPCKVVYESLHLPQVMQPPAHGSVIAVVTFPPDAVWQGKVGSAEVQSFFASMGAPRASTYSPQAPHPYMQKMRTLDFNVVLEGEVVLMLDTQEVHLRAGDIVVQLGANHAWSNRTNNPVRMAIISHDGAS